MGLSNLMTLTFISIVSGFGSYLFTKSNLLKIDHLIPKVRNFYLYLS